MWENILKKDYILKRNRRLAAVRQIRENISAAKKRLNRKLLPEDDRDRALFLIDELEGHLEFFSKPLRHDQAYLTGTKYLREGDVDDFMESYKSDLDELYDILEEKLD